MPPSSTLPKPEELLRAAFERLKGERDHISVRSIAARIGISPSYWSKILRGIKPLPKHLLPDVVRALRLDTPMVGQLHRAILSEIERDSLTPATGLETSQIPNESPVKDYRSLGRENFWMLEEWYYIPVLNLVTVTEFRGAEAEIARRLGLRLSQAEEAVRRLIHHGHLKRDGERLIRTEERLRFPVDRLFPTVRKYHASLLLKTRDELLKENAESTFHQRLISSVSFAGSSEKVEQARLLLEEAMYRAANLLADEPVCDEVYHLAFQLVPLTRKR